MIPKRRSKQVEAVIQAGNAFAGTISRTRSRTRINRTMTVTTTDDTSDAVGIGSVETKTKESTTAEDASSGCLGFGDNVFRYHCSKCNSRTASLRTLLSHRQTAHRITQRPLKNVDVEPDADDPSYYCKSCDTHYSGMRTFHHHITGIHHLDWKSLPQKIQPEDAALDPSEPEYHCSSCEYTCQHKQAYQEHLKTHHATKPSAARNGPSKLPAGDNASVYCAACIFTYASKNSYALHCKTMMHKINSSPKLASTAAHSKQYCELCHRDYKTAQILTSHNNRFHVPGRASVTPKVEPDVKPDVNDPNYYCRSCDKTLSCKVTYVDHLFLIHSIRQPSKIKGGLQPDANDRNNYCRACRRSYSNNKRYRVHLRYVHQMTLPRVTPKNSTSAPSDANDSDFNGKAPKESMTRRPIHRRHCKDVQRTALAEQEVTSNSNATININSPLHYCAQCERHFRNKFVFTSHLKAAHGILS